VGFFVIIGAISILDGSIKQNTLAFTSVVEPYHNSQSEIYVLDWKRNLSINLTRNRADEFDPEWSPDGSKIAFDSNRDGNYQIYIKNLDTGATSKLFQSSNQDRFPSWSPNDDYIAYLSRPIKSSPGSHQTWNINIVGVDNKNIITIPVDWDETAEEKPIWSPTSQYLTFRVYSDGKSAIYSFDMETHTIRNGLTPEAQNWYPAWSPDGEYLSFMSQQAAGSQIYVANIESGDTHPLSNSSYPNDTISSWSPNGAYIAVVSNDMRVVVRERTTGKVLFISPQFPSKLFTIAWLPNNEDILINVDYGKGNLRSGIYSLNIVTQKLQKIFQYISGIKVINLAPQ
jgi:Tol biopolymer transport system component